MELILERQVDKMKLYNRLFEDLIEKNKDEREQLGFLREKATKSCIIDTYTFWESASKRVIFDTLKKNSSLLLSEEFISKYSKDVLAGNRFVKDNFVNSFRENKLYITEEIICDSNNLDYDSLLKLLSKIFLDIKKQDIHSYFSSDLKLMRSIRVLKDVGVEKGESSFDVEGYLDLLVLKRNTIAHSHEVDLRYSFEQRNAIVCFIEELVKSVFSLIESKLIDKKIDLATTYESIPITNVYKCNKENDFGIFCLDFAGYKGNKKPFETQYYLKYIINSKNDQGIVTSKSYFERVTINEIRNENENKCTIFPKKGMRTLSFNSRKIVKKEEDYKIIEIDENHVKCEKYDLEVVIETIEE